MSPPEAERSFGKYRLQDRIAIGGMAEIYRARYQAAAGVTKPVVIKKILPAFAGNRNFVTMFINEAKIVVGLAHGNIAQVFDFGEIDGEYFLAMELVPGYPLSKVMKQARAMGIPVLPAPFASFIGLELCKGLHYAHTRRDEKNQLLNLIHRDVSPQNILLSYEGQVKIVDFGIAKARNATNAETQPGAVKGKYVYFAPEQCRGEPLDARTDVYAAGVVLYEMLTGRLPIEGRMIDVFRRIIASDFDRPRSVNANIPAPLEAIVLKALASDVTRRYQSAQELGDALAGFLYAQAPTFSTAALSQLMGYLYEKELLAEGFPLKISESFRREVDAWRAPKAASNSGDATIANEPKVGPRTKSDPTQRAPRVGAAPIRKTPARGNTPQRPDADEVTMPPDVATELAPRVAAPPAPPVAKPPAPVLADEPPTELNKPRVSAPAVTSDEPPTMPIGPPRLTPVLPRQTSTPFETPVAPTPTGPPKWLFVALPLFAMLVAALSVMILGDGTGTVELTSDPPGAVVVVDGTPAPTRTPVVISDLEPEVAHLIEVQAPGMRPWQQTLTLQSGETQSLNAKLQPAVEVAPPPPAPPVPTETNAGEAESSTQQPVPSP